MPHPTTNALVGLIVIDPLPHPGEAPAVDLANHDATLGQLLGWLARDQRAYECESADSTGTLGSQDSGARELSDAPRLAARFGRHDRPPRVTADFGGLDAQLECALTELRSAIAAA